MLLIVGSAASGKRSYARNLGYSAESMLDAGAIQGSLADLEKALSSHEVVYNLQDFVRQAMMQEQSFDLKALVQLLQNFPVVICNEVGSGVIPADATLTKAREQVGRLTILLAAQAQRVVRLVCGIPSLIKGESSCTCFFQNTGCEHFPCHDGVEIQDFNCLLCYCPLYALGSQCGGNYTYTEEGVKDCTSCTLPHQGLSGVERVNALYPNLKCLASK